MKNMFDDSQSPIVAKLLPSFPEDWNDAATFLWKLLSEFLKRSHDFKSPKPKIYLHPKTYMKLVNAYLNYPNRTYIADWHDGIPFQGTMIEMHPAIDENWVQLSLFPVIEDMVRII